MRKYDWMTSNSSRMSIVSYSRPGEKSDDSTMSPPSPTFEWHLLPFGHVDLELLEVNLLVLSERRRNGREDTGQIQRLGGRAEGHCTLDGQCSGRGLETNSGNSSQHCSPVWIKIKS